MDAIEKRSRALLDAELRKLGLHEDAHHVGCGADLDRNDQAAINAISAASTPPEGYVLVPVGLSSSMAKAAWATLADDGSFGEIWTAMLAARPEVP
ncbi:hypothetical protein [Stenotrophomonas geniculata]|uniref:hypothetical protein n=1 Tax=Stenotrophomonas geniculata TaxID=86188 RepID=UPI00070E36A0|nr:hypothetical protein [Stenotrophomonas geniculata]KRG43036.1 hypothetical protein ARC63_10375 [Stenotrophomonas geniculata ATCC 19374 = JCM 13324]